MTEQERKDIKDVDMIIGKCSLCGHALNSEAPNVDESIQKHSENVFDSLESKDAYLKHANEKEILGIHCIGDIDPDGFFHAMDSWINIYDENKNFKYSASRFHESFEDCVKAYLNDGWEIIS